MEEVIFIAIITIVASFLGTISGFGISTILVPALLFLFPFAETILLVGILHWFNDIWKLLLFRKGIAWKLIFTFGVPSVLFGYLGARLIFDAPELLLARILGGFLIIYGLFLLVRHSFKMKTSTPSAMAGGAISGFIMGIFGVGGPVRGAFLSAYKLPKAVYIATVGAIALATDSVRIVTYLTSGAGLSSQMFLGLFIFVPLSFLGAKLAERALTKIPEEAFRPVIAIFLVATGLYFVLFP